MDWSPLLTVVMLTGSAIALGILRVSSFIVEFTSLLLFGPAATLVVAGCAGMTRHLSASQRTGGAPRLLAGAALALFPIVVAGLVHAALGGTTGGGAHAWQSVAVGAAAIAYGATTLPLDRAWPRRVLEAAPLYTIGASVAVLATELVARAAWELLAVGVVPAYLAYRIYRDYAVRTLEERRRREVVDSLAEGLCSTDAEGRVTSWSDTLERLVRCGREAALGRPLAVALPVLAETELPRAVAEVLATRTPRSIGQLPMRAGDALRILEVRVLPVGGGATLLWRDVTEHVETVRTLTRQAERVALAAEGANDGLWEWDLRTQEFYVTGRWKTMLGLPGTASVGTPDVWFGRVHPDDIGPLTQAIEDYLAGRTDTFHHEHRIRHEDGTDRSFECRAVAVKRPGGRPSRMAGSLTDATDLIVTQERLRNAVFLDPLTGLCNRAVFVEGLGRRLKEFHRRRDGNRFALLYLDLDRFKIINDSLGHLVGDELLIAVSRRLETCLRNGDVLARLGGDEFAILLDGLHSEEQANVIAFRVQEALGKPFFVAGREVFTSASIGIAFGLAQYTSPDEIMHDADTAMYHAKARGKARHEVFDADMDARARDRLGLENDLRHAVKNNDFELVYQPIVSLASGMCVGFESLVRWTRNGAPVSPATFVPIAEELGLIEPLGTWVLQQACRTFAAWRRRFPGAGLDYITVNVSSRQLMQENFLTIVEQAVRQAGLDPRDLRIEITETALMTSPGVAAEVLSHLRDLGAKIYLDDFGTGYSSLSHLHKLPVDALKIDRSFVRSLTLPDRPAIVESILGLARTLNTSVVAEGIETEVQARELERLGCTHAQGFLFSRPLSTEAAEGLLVTNLPLGPKRMEVHGIIA